MAIKKITQKGESVLHQVSSEVPKDEITSKKYTEIITDMIDTLDSIPDGVGLAAPQIAYPYRIFIVSKKVIAKTIKNKKDGEIVKDLICINPIITKYSKTKKWMEGEGCLSVRWYYGKVLRSTNVKLEYFDEHGVKQTRGAGGLLAHIFQHEVDHLNGILFDEMALDLELLDEKDRPHHD